MEDMILSLISGNLVTIIFAIVVFLGLIKGFFIVPQSDKYVVERLGRLRAVYGAGVHLIIPFIDTIAHRVSILERQLPTMRQDAITTDNVLVQVDTSVFYRVTQPEKTVYRIRDVDNAISTTVAGIVRSEIGRMELDEVQSNRSNLTATITEQLETVVDDWGIEVTRAELLDVNLDQATREAMMQQLNAERARRAAVTEAEGNKRAVELAADAELYSARQIAEARRVAADAEAYATQVVAVAINENGMEAAQYQIALKQVEAIGKLSGQTGNQTIVLPAQAVDVFADAFHLLTGKK